jgi:hypothetical protein
LGRRVVHVAILALHSARKFTVFFLSSYTVGPDSHIYRLRGPACRYLGGAEHQVNSFVIVKGVALGLVGCVAANLVSSYETAVCCDVFCEVLEG